MYLACLQWVRENGCPWNEKTCEAAAVSAGHLLTCLQWARENGCKWDEETCEAAAEGGHFSCLEWVRENGCPWNERICCVLVYRWNRRAAVRRAATENGHL